MALSTIPTTTFKPHNEIQKLLNSLEPNETDINKITDVTHKCLLIMCVRDAAQIINSRKKTQDNDYDNDEKEKEEMKLFDEIIQKFYLVKLALLKEKLLK